VVRVVDAAHANADHQVALVRAHSLIETVPFARVATSPFPLAFGHDIYSFTRAAAVRRVLVTPTVPVVRRMSNAAIAPAWGRAIACIAIPMLLSFAWLVFVRQFDRGRPEPWWLLFATFALGALSVIPGAFAESLMQSATPYLSPTVMSLGGQLLGLPVALVVFTVTVGVVEEGVKFLAAWALARHRREFDEPVDGIVYACAAALGFAAIENVKYFAVARLSGSVVAARAFLSVPAHMFFSAIWGYALGRKLVRKETSVFAWFVLAAVAHGLFDTLLSIDGVQIFAIALDVALGLAFITLLRRSLRFGAIAPDDGAAPASTNRALFRMGSRGVFIVTVVAFVVLAAGMMTLGTAYEILHHKVGIVFIGIATTLLFLFGVAAYFLTQAIPLDVAIDDVGVTFAGVTSAWRSVLRVEPRQTRVFVKQSWVMLHTTDGVVRLGPCSADTSERMTTVLAGTMARAREG
jgi:RsiW-degrading membrane proteinase PrsW (M82 family)